MFLLKKLISTFVLPPGLFIVLFLLCIYLMLNKKYYRAIVTAFLSTVIIYLLSIAPVANSFMRLVEVTNWNESELKSSDVIVLLGGGVSEGVIDISGIGIPSQDSTVRLVDAARLYKNYKLPIIVSGGSIFGSSEEANVYARILADLDVPDNDIIKEGSSRDTKENARYVAEIMTQKGFKKAILVTSSYHMKRSMFLFEKNNVAVTPYPSGVSAYNKISSFADYLPRTSEASLALNELFGLMVYKITMR